MPPLETTVLNNQEVVKEQPNLPTRTRCRIPQRSTLPRPRIAATNKACNSQGTAAVRQRSESRSTNRSETAPTPRSARLEKNPLPPKKGPAYKKPFNLLSTKRNQNNQRLTTLHRRSVADRLPDQESIKRREELELQDLYQDKEIKISDNTSVAKVKVCWEKDLSQFESLKRDLQVQQNNIMELYAALRNTHLTMLALGQKVHLPSVEELKIMNVAKLTPDQLLKLCSGHAHAQPDDSSFQKKSSLDMEKLVQIPSKLVANCELTLHKRKEIIDWFQTLKSEEKGISMNKLTKKINEFTAENEMLASALNTSKAEFVKELGDIVDRVRKEGNDSSRLQMRIEDMTYEINELAAQNGELRKQLQATENLKFTHNKHKLDDLEKDLKEEKCKRVMIKDRLMRAEGQVKIGNERAVQLECALELARSQNWTLERTVQQLNEQNQKLQSDFDKELHKLTDSIKDNTKHLEEIADAREKLQIEKDELEKRLQELSSNYNESLDKINEKLKANVKILADTEKKLEDEKDERKNLEGKLEGLCSQLLESEFRYKEALKQLQVKDEELNELLILKCQLDETKLKLEAANSELQDHKSRIQKQGITIQEMETKSTRDHGACNRSEISRQNLQEMIKLERNQKSEIRNKEKFIAQLEKDRSLLQQQVHEGEHKMEIYEKQLTTLKNEIAQVHEEFGEFENMNQLHEMINEQRDKLLETTRQNGDLANALQQKELELESHLEQLADQQQILAQKDGVIKMLSDKEDEQAKIIKLLRSSMEMRAKADSELNQQLAEKNSEIQSLAANVETRKQQISQLEKIILTLEEQLRKVYLDRKRDHDHMTMLEKAITEYEVLPTDGRLKHCDEAQVDNLDNLIKILEDELGSSFNPDKVSMKKKNINNRKKCDPIEHCADGSQNFLINTLEDKESIQSIPRNQKRLFLSRDRDNLGRKQAITNMGTQKWLTNSQPINVYTSLDNKTSPVKGMVKVVMAGRRDDKKDKMLKLAGHTL